jgi:cytochrome c oxidase subunit 1
MTTISVPAHGADFPAAASHDDNYLTHGSGLFSWLFTLDHKRIGVMYLGSVLFALFLGGVFALLLRTELLTPGPTIMTADTYNRVFTLHGAVMVFLFIIPSIPASFGNFVLPVMLGAKDVAFPRLNLASYHCWLVGAVCFFAAILAGAIDTGWTFYTPYSSTIDVGKSNAVVWAVSGVFVLGFSSILTGINFITTMHKMRPPGMTWFKMPLFLWALYATSVIQVLATPVLAITLLLLIVERTLHIGIFDPGLGGDPVLFQHFFWFYSHPAVYIMILPAMGVISELVSIHSRKHIFGYRFIAFSSIFLALLGFLVWGHHMFTSSQSKLISIMFSALTFTVAIPSAIKVFNWLTTMYKGSINLNTPMCYALSFIFMFSIGGLTGLFLGALAVDIHLHDTYFVVAHFHYVMMGGTLIAFMGGLHHWWPKMFGKMYNENLGRIACLLIFIGFNLTFMPQFVMGSRGMPRRYYEYVPEFQFFHQLSTLGAYTLGVGFLMVAFYLAYSLRYGPVAPKNPWGGGSLEWECASPPPYFNFASPPRANDPYDFTDVIYDPKAKSYTRR